MGRDRAGTTSDPYITIRTNPACLEVRSVAYALSDSRLTFPAIVLGEVVNTCGEPVLSAVVTIRLVDGGLSLIVNEAEARTGWIAIGKVAPFAVADNQWVRNMRAEEGRGDTLDLVVQAVRPEAFYTEILGVDITVDAVTRAFTITNTTNRVVEVRSVTFIGHDPLGNVSAFFTDPLPHLSMPSEGIIEPGAHLQGWIREPRFTSNSFAKFYELAETDTWLGRVLACFLPCEAQRP